MRPSTSSAPHGVVRPAGAVIHREDVDVAVEGEVTPGFPGRASRSVMTRTASGFSSIVVWAPAIATFSRLVDAAGPCDDAVCNDVDRGCRSRRRRRKTAQYGILPA